MADLISQLEQLRKWRAWQSRDISIGSSMSTLQRSWKKANKQLSEIMRAWDELLPSELNQSTTPLSFRSGVLEVSVHGSPAAYQLNRLIRSGLLRQLQTRCSGTLRKIRIRVV